VPRLVIEIDIDETATPEDIAEALHTVADRILDEDIHDAARSDGSFRFDMEAC
jgi:hypothetical protein